MKNALKIFTALLFALNVMPVSAATQQDMQNDINALMESFKQRLAELENENANLQTPINQESPQKKQRNKKGMVCTNAKEHHLMATYDENGECIVKSCVAKYEVKDNKCVPKETATKNAKESKTTKNSKTNKYVEEINNKINAGLKVGDSIELPSTGWDAELNDAVNQWTSYCGRVNKPDNATKTDAIKSTQKKTVSVRCKVTSCNDGYKPDNDGLSCIKEETSSNQDNQQTETDVIATQKGNSEQSAKRSKNKCEIPNALTTKRVKNGECEVISCKPGFHHDEDRTECLKNEPKQKKSKTSANTDDTKPADKKGNEPRVEKAGEKCDTDDENAKTARYEKTGQGTSINCVIKSCKKGYKPSEDGHKCDKEIQPGDDCTTNIAYASVAKYNAKKECIVEKCIDDTNKKHYEISSDKKSCIEKPLSTKATNSTTATNTNTAKTSAANDGNDCTAKVPNAKDAKINENGDCKVYSCNTGYIVSFNSLGCIKDTSAGKDCHSEVEHATVAKYDSNRKCIVEDCEEGYGVSKNRKSCVVDNFNWLDPSTIGRVDYKVVVSHTDKLPHSIRETSLYSEEKFGDVLDLPEDIKSGDWDVFFSPNKTRLKGEYRCSNSNTTQNTTSGKYCWCKASKPNGAGWSHFGDYSDVEKCEQDCGSTCVNKVDNPNWLKFLFDSQDTVTNAGEDCKVQISNATVASINANGDCIVTDCDYGFHTSSDGRSCIANKTSSNTSKKSSSKKTFKYLDPSTINTTNYIVAYGEVRLLNSEKTKSFIPNIDIYDSSMECPELSEGEWCAIYDTPGKETVVTGMYQCNNSNTSRTDADASGSHCWCGTTEPLGHWAYFYSYKNANDCEQECGRTYCIGAADTNEGLHKMLDGEDDASSSDDDTYDESLYTSLKTLPQNDCVNKVDEMFKNGVPNRYKEYYNKYVERRNNTEISVSEILDEHHFCNYFIKGMTKKIVCRINHRLLKDCENATEQISLSAIHTVKEQVKEKYCGIELVRELTNLREDCGFTTKTENK